MRRFTVLLLWGSFFAALPAFGYDQIERDFPAAYYAMETRAVVTVTVSGSGLLPNATYSFHGSDDVVILQVHTDGSGHITDGNKSPFYTGGENNEPDGTFVLPNTTNWTIGYVEFGTSDHSTPFTSQLRPLQGFKHRDETQVYANDSEAGAATVDNLISFSVILGGNPPCAVAFHVNGTVNGNCSPVVQIGTVHGEGSGSLNESIVIDGPEVGDAYAIQVNGVQVGGGILKADAEHPDCPAGVVLDVGHIQCTPTPTPTPSATAGNTPTPAPSATPRITPGPSPTAPPDPTPHSDAPPGSTPPVVTTSTGAIGEAVIVENPQDIYKPIVDAVNALPTKADIYDAVKSGLEDAAGGNVPGTDGHAHNWDSPDLSVRGHMDDLQDQVDTLADDSDSARDSLVDKINSMQAALSTLPTSFGTVSSVPVDLSKFIAGAPTSIELTTFLPVIGVIRSIMLWMLTIAFFVATIGAFTYE